jgi:hypothetical protein
LSKILIIGCGRSGTRYASKVLRNCGLKIGHEREAGEDGMTSWMSIAKPEELEAFDVIFHQVREPLGVIASFKTVMKRTWRTIAEVEPRISLEDSLLLRSMKYWLYWNQLCEEKAVKTYRVENMMKELPDILKAIDVGMTDEMRKKASNVPTNDHTRQKGHKVSDTYEAVTWDDLECEDIIICTQIRDQAIRYGYDI